MWLRQSTASQEILLGRFVDSTDGNTEETALTIANTDIKLWVEGATTLTDKNSGGATHIANGMYYAVLDATDTATLGKLEVHVHVSGALAVKRAFMVLPDVVYDAMVLGTDKLDVALAAADVTGNVAADVQTIKTQTVTCAAGVTVRADVGAAAAPGAANGMLIGGSNAATTFATLTISGATTCTGNVSMAAGLTITQSTLNGHGLAITGNGSGDGVNITAGSGGGNGLTATAPGAGDGFYITGDIGIHAITNASTGEGIRAQGAGSSGAGFFAFGGDDGIGLAARGGTANGDAIYAFADNGHAVELLCHGTSKHGLFITGGNAGTSDGIKAVAGTGGVPIRGNITGDITGNLSGSVGSVTGAVGSVTGNVGGNVTGSVGSVTGAVGSVTGNVGGNVTGSVGSIATGGIAAASFAAGAIDAASLAASAGTEIADALLVRNVSNVEASAGEHTLCTVVLAMLENSISGTTLTIKRTDGSTTHATKTLTTNAAAEPIVGID